TDLMRPILDRVVSLTRRPYGADSKRDFGMRVLADHSRAMTFLVADGVRPANEGRGYILRRIIRRAVRYGRLLGLEGEFLAPLVQTVSAIMGGHYTMLRTNQAEIERVVVQEEERFSATL